MAPPLRECLRAGAAIVFPTRRRIAEEARSGEPGSAVLAPLVPARRHRRRHRCHQGVYAYALADIADRVVAFEPTPTSLLSRAGCCAAAPRSTK